MHVKLELIVGVGIARKVVNFPEGMSPFVGMTIYVDAEVGEFRTFKVSDVEIRVGQTSSCDEIHNPMVTLCLEAPVGFTTSDWNRFVSWAES